MSVAALTSIILAYKYWILIPLTFIEGPVVAFVAGTLAAGGYFNVYYLALLFLVRDVGMDCIYYAIGHYGGHTSFTLRMMRKVHVTEDHLEQVKALWEKYPFRTMFLGKISYGIASTFIFVAGAVGMNFRMFIKNGFYVAVLQYGVLLLLGYFFGNALGSSISHIIDNIQYLIGGAALFVSGYYLFAWYIRRKFYAEDAEAQRTPPPTSSR